MCAATTGRIRSTHEAAETARARPAEELAPSRPTAERETARPRFRSNITLVTIPVTVTDREGQRVRDRPAAAFHVFEDRVEQKVERLEPGTVPSDIALVAVGRLSQPEGRKAVVLLTDGIDTQSQLTDAAGALAAIETSNTPVFVVRYETGDAAAFMPPWPFGVRRWLVPPDGATTSAWQVALNVEMGIVSMPRQYHGH